MNWYIDINGSTKELGVKINETEAFSPHYWDCFIPKSAVSILSYIIQKHAIDSDYKG